MKGKPQSFGFLVFNLLSSIEKWITFDIQTKARFLLILCYNWYPNVVVWNGGRVHSIFRHSNIVGYFSAQVCSDDRFRCDNHICISIGRRCNGYDSCGDASVEKNCSDKHVFNFSFFSYVYLIYSLATNNVVILLVNNVVNNDILPWQ